MGATLSKADILREVKKMPDDIAFEDALERLIFLQKIRIGLSQEGEGVPQQKVEEEFAKDPEDREW